jgi:hypothetical protein
MEASRSEEQGDIVSKVVDALFSLVQRKGATALLDVIVNAPSEQAKTLHIKLLTTVVNCIAARSTNAQECSSPLKLSGIVPSQKFVEEILLQVIDVLYAYFAPVAWANCIQGKMSLAILEALKELTGAIGKTVPLIETASRILVSCQRVQKWHRSTFSSTGDERVFVSSIEQEQYASFLKSGESAKIGRSKGMAYTKLTSQVSPYSDYCNLGTHVPIYLLTALCFLSQN